MYAPTDSLLPCLEQKIGQYVRTAGVLRTVQDYTLVKKVKRQRHSSDRSDETTGSVAGLFVDILPNWNKRLGTKILTCNYSVVENISRPRKTRNPGFVIGFSIILCLQLSNYRKLQDNVQTQYEVCNNSFTSEMSE